MRAMPPIHPAANLFPMLPPEELQALANDIKANGLQQPIVLFGAQLLDGRNRWKACELAGVEPKVRDWSGKDPIAYVVSLNLKRRHLDESQRAMVAARIATMRQGARTDLSEISEKSKSQAAKLLSVSADSVGFASKVIKKGAPELAAAVDAGTVAVSTAADLTTLTQDEQREVVARGEKEILAAAKEIRARKNEDRRQERVQKLVEISQGNTDLKADRKYPLILADPPWRYEHVETESRAIENQYPTMSLEEICALPVGNVALDDCLLFMWTTQPKLEEAFRVLKAWGFNYRTGAVWDKQVIGMGYYFRVQVEHLLIAVKGNPPTPAPSDRLSNLVSVHRGKHSAKPEAFYEIIERMYPTLPKLEMFCRKAREGWAAWGNQA